LAGDIVLPERTTFGVGAFKAGSIFCTGRRDGANACTAGVSAGSSPVCATSLDPTDGAGDASVISFRMDSIVGAAVILGLEDGPSGSTSTGIGVSVTGASVGAELGEFLSAIGDLVGFSVGALVEGGLSVGLEDGKSVGVGVTGGLVGVSIDILVIGGPITTIFWDPKLPLTFSIDTPSNNTSK